MEKEKDIFEQFQDSREQFNVQPKEYLWEILEEKLDRKKVKQKAKLYRMLAFAAMITTLVAAVVYFNHYLNDHNPDLFASNEGFTAYVLEDLKSEEEQPFFNMDDLRTVQAAYQKKADNSKPLNIMGNYKASNGEIGFHIELNELVYTLNFDFEGLPEFKLNNIIGKTLIFQSAEGRSLILNTESQGLSVVESDFFHEYKGYLFRKLEEL